MPVRVFKEEEKEQLRKKMLEAGFPLLKEYGMTHTSVSKITDAAGIGTSTFYNFFKNKEEYMTALIGYHRQKIMPQLIPPDVLAGKRKLGRAEAKKFLLAMTDGEISIYAHMTLEDEAKIWKGTTAFIPDLEKESGIARGLLAYLEGVKENINLGLVANLTKILVLTAEAREELHEVAYEATLDAIAEMILNLICERDE